MTVEELKREYKENGCISSTQYFYLPGGKVSVLFSDYVNGRQFQRDYKSHSVAMREATKFMNRVNKSRA